MNKLIIANWKMNGSIALLDEFLNSIKTEELILGLPYIFIAYSHFKNKNIKIAAQDCSVFNGYGAHTGEISAKMLADSGAKFVIIGHSERRLGMHETIDEVYKKTLSALDSSIKVILCVDENYSSLIDQKTEDLLKHNPENVIIAYEPVSAIGTGVVPTIEEIMIVTSNIKNKYFNIKTVYGGSVNASNSKDILGINSVDGVLIGGASLKLGELKTILRIN